MMLPDRFEECLKAYDHNLSLRWGNDSRCWLVERREKIGEGERSLLHFASKQEPPDSKAIEEWRSCQTGRHIVVWTEHLDNRVFDALYLNDVQRHGFEVFDRTVRAANRKKAERRKVAHEQAKKAADVMYHMLNKQSSAIDAGKSDLLMKQALGRGDQAFKDTRFGSTLLDFTGRPITAAKKEVKLHLATR